MSLPSSDCACTSRHRLISLPRIHLGPAARERFYRSKGQGVVMRPCRRRHVSRRGPLAREVMLLPGSWRSPCCRSRRQWKRRLMLRCEAGTVKVWKGRSLMARIADQPGVDDLGHAPQSLSAPGVPATPVKAYDRVLECIEQVVESSRKSFRVAIGPVRMHRARQAAHARFRVSADAGFDVASSALGRAPRVFRMMGTEFPPHFIMELRKRLSPQVILRRFLFGILRMRVLETA